MSVVHIRGEPSPGSHRSVAEDMRELADKVEKGEMPAIRGVFVYQTPNKRIRHIALGEHLTLLEAVGMLAWSIDDVKEEGRE